MEQRAEQDFLGVEGGQVNELLQSKAFTFLILTLYALRASSYFVGKHYGPGAYWCCAFGITIAAEFLIPRWP